MERPQHELAAVAAKSKQSKVTGLALVIGIHVVIISALIVGLSNDQLRKEVMDISASVVAKKAAPKDLPPPPPAMVRPPPSVAAPPPQIVIAAPPPVVAAPVVAAPPPPPPPTELKSIEKTHTLPPYPALSQRMGEQGTTLLKVAIDNTGKVTDCTVVTSSGSTRLDAAAVEYVKANWRWQPPTQAGKPVSATTEVSVKWDLKNAQ
jgi:periplasmic protein TonB